MNLKIVNYLIDIVFPNKIAILWIILLSITTCVLRILIPIITVMYQSMLFISINSSVQFCIIFGIAYLIINKFKFSMPSNLKIILFSGICGAVSSFLLVYTSNPSRTPAIFQSIIPGLSVIFSAIMTKIILKKEVQYRKILIFLSLFFQIGGIVILVIFISSEWDLMSIMWTSIYLISIIIRCLQNILQEKYMIMSDDKGINTKSTLMFYERVFQFVVIIMFSWLDFFIGYNDDMVGNFYQSMVMFGTEYQASLLFESFIFSYILLYIFSVYLNQISTNYNMITSTLTNPSVAIFFTIFPNLNPGIKFPLYATIISVSCSIIGVILWIQGEKIINDKKNEQTGLINQDNEQGKLINN